MSEAPRPRMLFIAPVMPDAGGNGLAMRQGQFLAAYARDFDVDLVVIPLAGVATADDRFAQRHTQRLGVMALDGVDTHFSLLMRLRDRQERIAAFRKYGRPSIAARLTQDVEGRFLAWIAERRYDLVHTGRLYLLSLGVQVNVPHVIDADEDDARVFRLTAVEARRRGDELAAAWAEVEAENAARAMTRLLPEICHVFTASQPDAAALAPCCRAVTVIPNVAVRPWLGAARPGGLRILFVGTFGYRPNADAIVWFIKECWPRLHKCRPLLRLDVVGGEAVPALRRLAVPPGISWHGRQKNLRRFYARTGVVIVPVLVGGGSRIKLLEAAANGRPIVATTAGAQGSDLRPIRDFIRADGAQRFGNAVMAALAQKHRLGRAARKAVEQAHDPGHWQRAILEVARAIASGEAA